MEQRRKSKKSASKSKLFFDGNDFKFDAFAKFLANKLSLARLDNHLFIAKEGRWLPATDELDRAMILFIPELTASRRLEVRRYLNLLVAEESKPADARFLAFNNGVYDLATGHLVDPAKHLVVNTIPWNYNPAAYSSLADKVLNDLACKDQEIRLLLEEIIGYSFYRRNELGKAFILVGDKANGKSTFLNMLQNLIGKQNCSNLDLSELNDRFRTACISGKLVNIGDDIGDRFICNPAIFKKLVTGESITAENKGEAPFSFCSYCKLLFSANVIPTIKDPTGAVLRRLVIVPFMASFTKDSPDYDPFIKYKLQSEEVMEYLINLGLAGLQRILTNRYFTESSKVAEELKRYQAKNDPVLSFMYEFDGKDLAGKPTREIYEKYKEWCIDTGNHPITIRALTERVTAHYHLELIKKKSGNSTINYFV